MHSDALTFGPLRGFTRVDQWLLLSSIAAATTYLATGGAEPFPGSIAVKAMSIAPLAILAFRLLRHHDRLLLGGALSVSSFGDILLDLPDRYFVHGLLAFLVAHVLYITLFVRGWPRPLRPRVGQVVLAMLVIAHSALLLAWLAPALGALTVPATLYSGALTLMAVTAILAKFAKPIVPFGAILFVLSDSMIAAGRFKTAVPLAAYLIWATYYAGQYCIAIGFLRDRLGGDSPPDAPWHVDGT